MNDYHPPYLRSSEDWAKTLWGHFPEKEFQANLEFMRDMGRGLKDQAHWMYVELGLIFTKDEGSSDDEEIFWFIKRAKDREEFAVNYDGEHFYLILQSEIDLIQTEGVSLEKIEKIETALGLKSVMVSSKALLAGNHVPACIHEYCLDNNLYSGIK